MTSLSRSSFLRSSTILERSSSEPFFSPLQNQVDGLVGDFTDQATDLKTLSAMVGAGMAYRIARVGTLAAASSFFPEGNALASLFARSTSYAAGLAGESAAFAGIHRGFRLLEGNSPTQSFGKEFLNTAVSLGSLKFFGRLGKGQNPLLQHLLADTGMVASHQFAALVHLEEKPEGDFSSQLLHAEAMNWQMKTGMGLVHGLAPRLLAAEKSMDLSLKSQEQEMKQGALALLGSFVPAEGAPEGFSTHSKKSEGPGLFTVIYSKESREAGFEEPRAFPIEKVEEKVPRVKEIPSEDGSHNGPAARKLGLPALLGALLLTGCESKANSGQETNFITQFLADHQIDPLSPAAYILYASTAVVVLSEFLSPTFSIRKGKNGFHWRSLRVSLNPSLLGVSSGIWKGLIMQLSIGFAHTVAAFFLPKQIYPGNEVIQTTILGLTSIIAGRYLANIRVKYRPPPELRIEDAETAAQIERAEMAKLSGNFKAALKELKAVNDQLKSAILSDRASRKQYGNQLGQVLLEQARISMMEGHYHEAAALCQEASRAFQGQGSKDRRRGAQVLRQLALARVDQEELSSALPLRVATPPSPYERANRYMRSENWQEALPLLREALEEAKEKDDKPMIVKINAALQTTYEKLEQWEEAFEALHEAEVAGEFLEFDKKLARLDGDPLRRKK